jgi:hypothetical protein
MADPKPDKLSAQDLAAEYNYAYALLMSDPELKRLFETALKDKKGQWTAAKFAAKLRTTKWYRTHSETWRNTEALRVTDPQQYKADLAATKAKVIAQASALGVALSPAEQNALAEKFYRYGYDDSQVRQTMATYMDPPTMPGGLTGQAGEVEDQLRMLATRNGQKYSDDFYFKAAQAVVSGKTDIQAFSDQVRRDAATSYPIFADKITAGMDVADLASGYVNRIAQTFEMDPEQVTLDDPYIKKALGGMAADGTPTAMGMWDFEKELRADPRWAKTKQAKDAADGATYSVLKTFGFIG